MTKQAIARTLIDRNIPVQALVGLAEEALTCLVSAGAVQTSTTIPNQIEPLVDLILRGGGPSAHAHIDATVSYWLSSHTDQSDTRAPAAA